MMRMRQGAHGAPRARAFAGRKRAVVIAAAVAALSCVAVGGTIAWLSVSGHLTNHFTVGKVVPVINECVEEYPHEHEDGVTMHRKKDVSVTSESTVPIYVRMSADAYWRQKDGTAVWFPIYFDDPGPTAITGDIDIAWGNVQGEPDALNPAQGCWISGGDGYYYWSRPLEAGATTGNLIDSLKMEYPVKDGASDQLVVDFVAQGIQASPSEAAIEAWGVQIAADGTLAPANASDGALAAESASGSPSAKSDDGIVINDVLADESKGGR